MTPELLTIEQFCKFANCGRTNTYKLINSGKLKAIKLGKKTLIPRKSANEWLQHLEPYLAESQETNK